MCHAGVPACAWESVPPRMQKDKTDAGKTSNAGR